MAARKVALAGKTVLITGATSGLGREAAIQFARSGAKVLITCRDEKKGKRAKNDIEYRSGSIQICVKKLDLSSFHSVKCCAEGLIKENEKIDILINNAGMIGVPYAETEDKNDIVMQTNHLGHFMLTHLLLDFLKNNAPCRIINVSSLVYKYSNLNVDNLNVKDRSTFYAYSNSKLAGVLFTKELARRLEGTGITVNAIHPGIIKTGLLREATERDRMMAQIFQFFAGVTAEEAVKPIVKLAVDPAFADVSGKYFEKSKECPIVRKFSDDALARRLFGTSKKIIERYLSKHF